MIAGIVKFYNSERGFGYVQQLDGTREYRVLVAVLARAGIKSLSQGQKVNFKTHTDPGSGKTMIGTIEIAQSGID